MLEYEKTPLAQSKDLAPDMHLSFLCCRRNFLYQSLESRFTNDLSDEIVIASCIAALANVPVRTIEGGFDAKGGKGKGREGDRIVSKDLQHQN